MPLRLRTQDFGSLIMVKKTTLKTWPPLFLNKSNHRGKKMMLIHWLSCGSLLVSPFVPIFKMIMTLGAWKHARELYTTDVTCMYDAIGQQFHLRHRILTGLLTWNTFKHWLHNLKNICHLLMIILCSNNRSTIFVLICIHRISAELVLVEHFRWIFSPPSMDCQIFLASTLLEKPQLIVLARCFL